jgi:hypothetical protein
VNSEDEVIVEVNESSNQITFTLNSKPNKMKKHFLLTSLALITSFSFVSHAAAQTIGANFVDETHGNGGPGSVYTGTGVLGETFVAFEGPGEEGNQSEGPILLGQGVSLKLAQNDTGAADYFQYSGGGATDLFSNALIDDFGAGFTFTLSGLTAGKSYNVAVYGSDNVSFVGGSASWTVQGKAIGSTTGTSGAAFSNGQNYLVDDNVVANSLGDIVIVTSSGASFTQYSGVSVAAVPEPSSYVLSLIGGLALVIALRRTTSRKA